MGSWLQPVAAVAGGGEVEFPILLFICPENRRLSPWKPNMSITFFPCLGQDGKNQSIFELIDVGTSRPCPWQVLDGHFRVIFDAVHLNQWIAFGGNMAIQKSCSCRDGTMNGTEKTPPGFIKALEIELFYSMPGPLISGLAVPVIQDHQIDMWIKMDDSIATN